MSIDQDIVGIYTAALYQTFCDRFVKCVHFSGSFFCYSHVLQKQGTVVYKIMKCSP